MALTSHSIFSGKTCITHPAQPRSLLALAVQATIIGLLPAASWAQDEPATQTLISQALPQVEVRDTAEKREPGASATVSGQALEQANDMADIVRYQPLVSAPGTASGASRNRSSFDRAGTTGYNIRGIEGNRIGMDVDGIELPNAATRPYASRAGSNTFGVGRDFIDPEMFSSVSIDSGTTTARRTAGGIGGSVGFRTKSVEDFLRDGKSSYIAGKVGYDSVNRSWNESVTAAGRSGDLDGLIAFSRRDGHETRNNSDIVSSSPDSWHSNALLLKGGLRIDSAQRLVLSADLYRRKNNTLFNGWDSTNSLITENSQQASDTSRNTLQLQHLWTPQSAWVDQLDSRLFLQNTKTDDATDTTTLSTGATVHNISGTKTSGWGFSSTGDKRLDNHRLSFGINASTEDMERPWNVSGFMQPQPDTKTTRYGAFLQDEISWQAGGRRLALIPALRVDRVEIKPRNLDGFATGALTPADVDKLYGGTHGNNIASPSLSLVYELTPQFSAYAQFKRSGRAPSAGEIFGSWNMASNYNTGNQYALIGNAGLKQETSNAFDLGLKGSPMPGVVFNGSIFHTKYSDFIAYTRYTRTGRPDLFGNVPNHIGTIYQAENRDSARIYGMELSARLEHGQWTPALQGLYTHWAMGLSRGTSKSRYDGDKSQPLDSVLPRKAIIGAGYDAPAKRWGVNLTGTFVAGKQAVATNRDSYMNAGQAITESTTQLFRVPGYAIFDLVGYWQLAKNVRLNAGIYNLGDRRYWDYSSTRNLQPAVAKDQRDIELLSNPGRTFAVSMNVVF
ncbi:TonB-dependent hemoglobin/transferrin/lactoferrin family receptor [Comamonas composti]|uniref:TonB-dependent hemoglobin/transferrin/lactoferrin family receptor n=1 Tax=Comamonas composti TaxID=408558 RepID=UPI000407788B|nr:TonB-dependent hemoglobin/transferrin/lactoferrin family receptor [Comamonas composti]